MTIMKKDKKPIFLCDMDGTLFDYDGAMIKALNKLRHPSEPKITNENLWTLEKTKFMNERMTLIKKVPNWWFKLKPIKEGFEIFKYAASIGYRCQILTKGPQKNSGAWSEKHACIRKYFGEDVEIHITEDKGQLYGNILYDDYPEYMDSWLAHRPRGLGIMPNRVSNKHYSNENVIKHGNSEKDIENTKEAILKFYNSVKKA